MTKLRLISQGEHKDAFGTHKWKTYAQIPTNADRIRSMTDEELAAWLADHPVVSEYDENNPQHKAWLEWLKQEAQCTSE